MENISAISTGLVASGVGVIRISGDSPLKIAEKMFKPNGKTAVKDFEPNKMYVGEIECDGFSDFGMCVYFKAPKSFTGEDVVEFHCHGGIAIVTGVLKKTLECGARLATNGEFSKRAFINGKMSLSSAEGLIDMINSESQSGVKAGYYLYREKLTDKVIAIQDIITDCISEIDADMDFPEEDLEFSAREKVLENIQNCLGEIDGLLATFYRGRTIKNGVKVGIVGKPNTGKSSLLNAFLAYDKAIVSSVEGTTRDVVEGDININGVKFHFSDTAGIRESADYVEELGVLLSKKVLEESDLLLFVMDGSNVTQSDEEIFRLIKDKNKIVVVNKSDIDGCKKDDRADIYISAKEGANVEQLKDLIYKRTVGDGVDLNGDFLCEERHYDALSRASQSLLAVVNAPDDITNDLFAIDLKNAWDALGEISGKTATEEIINNIFSKFCVGK